MSRKTKIICTLGPASERRKTLHKMAEAGMDVVRLNFSHGSHEQHQQFVDTIREINKTEGFNILILQDLEGYRVRIGELERPVHLMKHQIIYLVSGKKQQQGDHIPLDSKIDITQLKPGMSVFIADGIIALDVVDVEKNKIKLEVVHGGALSSRKGVNIPGLLFEENILTEKDRKDIQFGIKNKVDFIAQSFVRNATDIGHVRETLKNRHPDCRIFAKVENQQGVANIANIINASDGVMVARGDLGVSLPIYQIPFVQKDIIKKCNLKGKPVVTCTQMLESMSDSPRPTRAEVSDVANAILDGTDYVMLSGETAAGSFPVKAVRMMCEIIDYTEKMFPEAAG